MKGEEKGAYIKLELSNIEEKRKDQRDEHIEKRTKELLTEIPDGLQKLKKLSKLGTTIKDGIRIQDFAMRVLDVHPENVKLLATEADAIKIIKHVRVGGEES